MTTPLNSAFKTIILVFVIIIVTHKYKTLPPQFRKNLLILQQPYKQNHPAKFTDSQWNPKKLNITTGNDTLEKIQEKLRTAKVL